jgi:regulator of sigma E protease
MQLIGDGSNLLLIILGFGLLIAIHELGHFLAARWAGIRVDAFAVGMGPAVLAFRRGIGWKLGSTTPAVQARFGQPAEAISRDRLRAEGVSETEYGLRLLPLGGFVRMKGQEDLVPTESSGDGDAYGACPVWKRMVVVSAGVVANLVLAIALYVAAFMVGVRFEGPAVGEVRPDGPASRATDLAGGAAGLQPGDLIERIDGDPVRTFADVQIASAMSRPGRPLQLQVKREGVEQPMRFEVTPAHEPGSRLLSIGIAPARGNTVPVDPDAMVILGPSLDRAGLTAAGVGPGSSLVKVGSSPVSTLGPLLRACADSGGAPVATLWRTSDGGEVSVALQPLPLLPRIEPADASLPEEALLGLAPLTRIEGLQSGSPNGTVLRAGDVVASFAGTQGPSPTAFRDMVMARAGQTVEMDVLRDGSATRVQATVDASGRLGVMITPAFDTAWLARPIDRERRGGEIVRTAAAALEAGPLARIASLDGQPVRDWIGLVASVQAAARRGVTSVQLGLIPWGQIQPRETTLPLSEADRQALAGVAWTSPLPAGGFDPVMTTLSAGGNPVQAAAMGFRETGNLAVMTWLTIDRLVRGSVPVDQLRGPVGIVHVGTRVADRGFMYLIFFLAMISVNLAVLNFLPLPIVDGGLFLFLVYEAMRGRPPSVRFQNAATMAGLALIGSLFVVTFYNDVMRLVSGG